MTTTETKTTTDLLTGSFRDRASAERAYDSLVSRGYSKDEINVIMSDDTRKQHFSETSETTELGTKAAEGGLAGATVGGTVGAIAGVLAVAGTLAIPGLGLVLAGPVAAGLAGLGAGAAAGGLLGALIGAGIPEERAKVYKTEIENGGIVVGVKPRSAEDVKHFEQEWSRHGGGDIRR
ncbi:MAG: hypothetical protein ABR551_09960 [Gemmatimonadales bacterium]